MRERLVNMIQDSVYGCARNWAEVIADYLLENGVIVRLVRWGDTVYITFPAIASGLIDESEVSGIIIGTNKDMLQFGDGSIYTIWDKQYDEHFGRRIFLTREEAEKALKGGDE